MNDPSSISNPLINVVDDLAPEDLAMLQALYSRSSESYRTHLDKIKDTGSGKFMSSFYVGYGHKSIADCGSTTIFIEDVSLLAAKAIQDWPMYSGQETSTRYIDMTYRNIVDPLPGIQGSYILSDWMHFYRSNQEQVAHTVKERHPIRPGENPYTYEKSVVARVFDIMRGFLPAGITTQLSWHTNLRQAGDHLLLLSHHPSEEIRDIAETIKEALHQKYPSSGFLANTASVSGVSSKDDLARIARITWEEDVAKKYTYQNIPPIDPVVAELQGDHMTFYATPFRVSHDIHRYINIIASRPRGCVLPHFLNDLGQFRWNFLLDFGSFRDIQRHRNGVCRMPLLTTNYGFEPWYIEQLDDKLQDQAKKLIDRQTKKINSVTDDVVIRQYYTALGYRVQTSVTYGLPAAVYVMELRSGKMIHPTLRSRIHKMIEAFRAQFPMVPLHVDLDPSDWDVRRGTQTITEK